MPDKSIKYQRLYSSHRSRVEPLLRSFSGSKKPCSVYEPIDYVLSSGGKRVRAVLTLLACEAVGGKLSRALPAAAAVEILHNFTLVHDDVMDHAELRRGRQTVHKKWDENVAILAGDEMIAQAYGMLLKTRSPRLKQVMDVYTDALIQVCEGQGYDKEFETRRDVSLPDYYRMISKKTGRVITAALEIGGLVGMGNGRQLDALRNYGEYLGRAFQIKDDLLDIKGNKDEFGKVIGGDLREGKKTFLLLKGLECTKGADYLTLKSIKAGNKIGENKIRKIRYIYQRSGVLAAAAGEIERNTIKAQKALKGLNRNLSTSTLRWLSDRLLDRNS